MKVLHAVGSFYPAVSLGGPIESNRALCRMLARLGTDVKVLTTNADGPIKVPEDCRGWRRVDGYEVFYGNRWFWRDLSPALAGAIWREVRAADVVHLTGTYNWFLPIAVHEGRRRHKPMVLSPRGSLMPEARQSSGLRKRAYDSLIQDRALAGVTAFHATSENEGNALTALFPHARVAVIPNGVDVPDKVQVEDSDVGPYMLYLGRLHPYKMVDRLIEAFGCAMLARQATDGRLPMADWTMVIAGDGDRDHRRELVRVAGETGVADRVRFVGQVAGERKSSLLAGAGFVIQAARSENFGNVVAEALAHGTPVLAGKGLPWAALDREGCGFWVNDSREALADGILRLIALSCNERRSMGARGREWMARSFSWESVARQMSELYGEVSTKPKVPGAHRVR